MTVRSTRWAIAALGFVAAEALLRLYWVFGGRWAYTACDRTHLPSDPTGGCGADQVTTIPFSAGWGALIAVALMAAVAGWAMRRPGRASAAGAWSTAMALGVLAFPLHLLFELPVAIAGHPDDWRDLAGRLALVAGAAAFAGLAASVSPVGPPAVATYRPVAGWTRRWAYTSVALPVVGWAVPHTLWVLGIPFGIPAEKLTEGNLSVPEGLAITLAPPLAGLLALGLIQRWGQQFPRWVPALGGRRVPRLLALIPAGVVALTLMFYGFLSAGVMLRDLTTGALAWGEFFQGWAVALTLVVFTGWGLALGVTAYGYHRATRPLPAA